MRVRFGILALVLVAALSACGGSDTKGSAGSSPTDRLAPPTASLTELTVPCTKFADTAAKIAQAQRDLYTQGSTKVSDAVAALVSELDQLKAAAPDSVRTALGDLADGFRSVGELIKHPTAASRTKLAELGPKLAADGQTLTAYITSQCH